jgi:hypothetical protein
MNFRKIVALFAGLGVVSPIALFAVDFYCNAHESDWWLLLWPTGAMLLGDTREPRTSFELFAEWCLSLAANPVLYALVGVIVASLLAGVRRLRAKLNQCQSLGLLDRFSLH